VVVRVVLFTLILGVVGAVGVVMFEYSRGSNAVIDRDRDGLDDRLEEALAKARFPAIHEYGEAEGLREECGDPLPRPVLFRARPRVVNRAVDPAYVAITYVLLYMEDCGFAGHRGDNEAFTVFLHRAGNGEWQTVSGSAIAHQGTSVERRTIGNGQAMWVTRNKHSNYASFDACDDRDPLLDLCAKEGPSPKGIIFLNVGEPGAPLSNDVGDLFAAFRGQPIWNHQPFMEAGDITAQLFITPSTYPVPSGLAWDWEDSAAEGPPRAHP